MEPLHSSPAGVRSCPALPSSSVGLSAGATVSPKLRHHRQNKPATCWQVILSQGEMSGVCWKHFYTGITVKEQQQLF